MVLVSSISSLNWVSGWCQAGMTHPFSTFLVFSSIQLTSKSHFWVWVILAWVVSFWVWVCWDRSHPLLVIIFWPSFPPIFSFWLLLVLSCAFSRLLLLFFGFLFFSTLLPFIFSFFPRPAFVFRVRLFSSFLLLSVVFPVCSFLLVPFTFLIPRCVVPLGKWGYHWAEHKRNTYHCFLLLFPCHRSRIMIRFYSFSIWEAWTRWFRWEGWS